MRAVLGYSTVAVVIVLHVHGYGGAAVGGTGRKANCYLCRCMLVLTVADPEGFCSFRGNPFWLNSYDSDGLLSHWLNSVANPGVSRNPPFCQDVYPKVANTVSWQQVHRAQQEHRVVNYY